MIVTVTPNPALDLTWHVDALEPGETHRMPTGVSRAGGKGLNAARVLHATGHRVIALATAGGASGDEFRAELEASGVAHELVPVGGATRRSVAIVDEGSGETTILNEFGAALTPRETARLAASAERLARTARVVAVCGSLPPGFEPEALGELVARLVAGGTRVIVDTSGPGILAAARAGADALKPNRDELETATGHRDPVSGARVLIALGARLVVVSLGADGLVVVARGGAPVHARLPQPLHGNATGAGDAAVAAIAAALADGDELDLDTDAAAARRADLARRATAWSASAVLMPVAGELSPEHAALEHDVLVSPISEDTR
jgi:1-phosphofructokinase family hexose kinase